MDVSKWKEYKLNELFDCVLSKGDLKEDECPDGPIPLVSSGATNNGIVKYIGEEGDGKAQIFDGNCITLDMFCNSFYQPNRFYAVSHGRVNILIPKFHLNDKIALFITTIINREKFKFSYGRAIYNSVAEQITINLPTSKDGNPDWDYMESFIDTLQNKKGKNNIKLNASIATSNKSKNNPINTDNWKEFSFDDLFVIKKGTRLTVENMEAGDINFIGAIDSNNGVREKIGNGSKFSSNYITVNYNGSVGEAFYQCEPFWASDDVNVLELKDHTLNKYIGLFLCTLIKMEKFKFSYGRKWNVTQMKQSFLKLPVTESGKPDWDYMENYIKALPYADRL